MHARAMTDDRLRAWLAVSSVPTLSPAKLNVLLSAFGDIQALLVEPPHILAETAGDDIARAVAAAARADVGEQLERTRKWCEQPGNALLARDDPAYPSALLTMHDPPPLLYVSGQLTCLHAPAVAIVGSRNATPQALDDAARFARELAGSGLVIVSGLALGVDCAAHRGALDVSGVTVAVVGTGADVVYPAKHRALASEIALSGALVSEWPLGTPAKPSHFPQRNRLIAAMTQGVLVVEAALRSGTLITARLANEMGRDVFAIPGSIHAPLSRGCHQLIKDGAMLTETPDDVLDALGLACGPARRASPAIGLSQADSAVVPVQRAGYAPRRSRTLRLGLAHRTDPTSASPFLRQPPLKPATPRSPRTLPLFETPSAPRSLRTSETPPAAPALAPAGLSADATRLLAALGHAPAALEILSARTEMGSAALQGALLELELRGYLAVLPGGRFVRHSPG